MVSSENKAILSSGRFDGTSREQLSNAFATFRSSPQKDRLVLHFHGGLVPLASGEAKAARLLPLYRGRADAYPFFVIWQSGLWEVLRHNWQEIVEQDLFPRLVERVVQFIWGKLDQKPGEKGLQVELPTQLQVQTKLQEARAGKEPLIEREAEATALDSELAPAELQQLTELIQADPVLAQAGNLITNEDLTEFSPELQKDVIAARKAVSAGERGLIETGMLVRAAVRIVSRCLKRFASKRNHGIYTTAVEEVAREIKGDLIGGIVWKHMKKDTADSFSGAPDSHGGSAILEEINNLYAGGSKPQITLVGHSAGAVFVCYFLQAANKVLPPEVKFNVIFLAPACTFKLFDETLSAAGNRIAAFRTFAMEDKIESEDRLFPPLYMRSLLYFVSGLVEEEVDMPLVGMKRYYLGTPFDAAAFPAVDRVLQRFRIFPNSLLWSKTETGLGLSTVSVHHGDFDSDEQTLASMCHIISKGFA